VVVTAGDESNRTNVTNVSGDGIVELEEIPPTSGDQRDLRIAKIGENDPMGNADSAAMVEMGLGWMRWIFDPYGQFQYRLQPDDTSFWGIVARIARYLFGTTSWSALFPPGWWVWDNAIPQSSDEGFRSQMEQEASAESGDLYSPVGRLRGTFSWNDDNERYQGVVGDIGRYWYFLASRTASVIMGGQRDTPGTPYRNDLRVLPDWTGGGSPAGEPNQDGQTGGQTPGLAVPDLFFNKGATTPLAITDNAPDGFRPGSSGYVPASARLERTLGMYAAFCLPGQHRVTISNGLTSADEGRLAQEAGQQHLFFDVDIADVGVTVARQPVLSTLTDDGSGNFMPVEISLVQLQRALIQVAPAGNRRYAVTLPQASPGAFLQTSDGPTLIAMNRNTTTAEPVEISRVYRFVEASEGFDDGVLNAHGGVHLRREVHVPVRLFRVNVVDTLPLRQAISLEAADIITGRQPGQTGFIMVPAAVEVPLQPSQFNYPGGTPTPIIDPRLQIDPETTPLELQTFVADGAIYRVTFPADSPPEEEVEITLSVTVGHEDLRADLTTAVTLQPHFRLLLPGAGHTVRNDGSTITLQAEDAGNNPITLAAAPVRLLKPDGTDAAGLTATVNGAEVEITASASAGAGLVQVICVSSSDATQQARRTIEVVS
jgi:hypothetical protein